MSLDSSSAVGSQAPEGSKGSLGRPGFAMSVIRELRKEWADDRLGSLGAEIAFFGILSLFPALLALVAALGFLDAIVGSEIAVRSETETLRFLERLLTSQAEPLLDDVRTLFQTDSRTLFSFATAAAIWAASRGTLSVIRALNIAYDLPPHKSWLRTRGKALALAAGSILTGVFLLAVLVLGPLLGAGRALASAIGPQIVADVLLALRYPAAFLVVVGWAAAIFYFAPNYHTSWKHQLPGAIATAFLALAASVALRLYLTFAGQTNVVLGLLGGPLILMVWLYLLSLALLLGGELNDVLRRLRRNPEPETGE